MNYFHIQYNFPNFVTEVASWVLRLGYGMDDQGVVHWFPSRAIVQTRLWGPPSLLQRGRSVGLTTRLRAGPSGFQIRARSITFSKLQIVQSGSGALREWETALFPGSKWPGCHVYRLCTYVIEVKMGGATPLLPPCAFTAWTWITLPFVFLYTPSVTKWCGRQFSCFFASLRRFSWDISTDFEETFPSVEVWRNIVFPRFSLFHFQAQDSTG